MAPQYPHQAPQRAPEKRDPEATRKMIGWVFYFLLMAIGGFFLFGLFIIMPLIEDGGESLGSMGIGALLALPLLCLYIWVPWIIDRYDPEPLWALVAVLAAASGGEQPAGPATPVSQWAPPARLMRAAVAPTGWWESSLPR